ncbi:MAG TPA: type 1 glutamine amidotransferase [Burkholderiales bacterium]|nr:type 1 glutamine amidotransferase [Burkholderiales bacterium]
MKSVIICRYAPTEGPGYFASYLTARQVAWRTVKLDEGESLPPLKNIAGLAMMGGPMSVNDDLPWIEPMLALIRASVSADVPVIGHCLGGQLLAKALGAAVTRNSVKEIGWGEVAVLDHAAASSWGPSERFLSYHWHGETFAIPEGAVRIWSSEHCANQAFAMGKHLGMQCHVEMTAEMIETWCETGAREIAENLEVSPAVQNAEEMRKNLEARVEALHRMADRIYDRWLQGLKL